MVRAVFRLCWFCPACRACKPVRTRRPGAIAIAAVGFVFAWSMFAPLWPGTLRPHQFAVVFGVSQSQIPRSRTFGQRSVNKWVSFKEEKLNLSATEHGVQHLLCEPASGPATDAA